MDLIFGEENVGQVINHSEQRTVRAHTLSWDYTDEPIQIMYNPDGSVFCNDLKLFHYINGDKIHWSDSVIPESFSIEKEIEAADSDKIDEFLS